ncbi:translation initiation factor IF-3 [Chloroflexota bacterium]
MEEVHKDIIKPLRVNDRIRAKEVRLVGDKGEQLGVMLLYQAREVAQKQNLDLVEVAANVVPPVCRLIDYGRYKYEQEKKERQNRKSQRSSLLREVRMRPKIGVHDLEAKIRSARRLLNNGDKVMVSVLFRGREITHPEIAWRLLKNVTDSLKDMVTIDKQPVMNGRRMTMILSPVANKKIKPKEEVKEA